MFETIDGTEHNVRLVDDCYVGRLRHIPPFCYNAKVSGSIISAPSVRSMIDFVEKHCPEPKRSMSSSTTGTDSGFRRFDTWEETLDVFRNRPHTLQQFDPVDEKLTLPTYGGNEVQFDTTGDFFDMGRVLSGEPEAWGHFIDTNPRKLYATIVVNIVADYTVSGDVLTHRCNRLQRLVYWLENQNIRCQIKAFKVNECGLMELYVKHFDQYLDLDALAIVGCPDFHRRIWFRFIEYSDTWQSGYGRSYQINRGELIMPKQFTEEKGIFLFTDMYPTIERMDAAFDTAEARIKQTLEDGFENLNIAF